MEIEYDAEYENRCEYEQENIHFWAETNNADEEYFDRMERARDMQIEINNIWK